jgi:hypothetical protein
MGETTLCGMLQRMVVYAAYNFSQLVHFSQCNVTSPLMFRAPCSFVSGKTYMLSGRSILLIFAS